jgi:dihydroflavonol-4-reductase
MILVTGANGLVGAAIVRCLLKNNQAVRALKRSGSNTSSLSDVASQIEWVEGDVLDVASLETAMQGVSQVIHAAAMVLFSPKERSQMYKVNVEGTANVVNVCMAMGVQKLAFVSSIAALGRPDVQYIDPKKTIYISEEQKWEDSPLNSHYAKSKYQAELEVWRGVAEGLPTVIVNPSIVLGEGDWTRSSTQLFKYVYDQNKFYTEGLVNYVDVLDVATIIVRLLLSDIQNERFVLNAGTTTYKDLFEQIAKGFGRKPPSIRISPFMSELIWRIETVRSFFTGKNPLITQETAKSARTRFGYDSNKIQKKLNFSFTTLSETIKRVTENTVNDK